MGTKTILMTLRGNGQGCIISYLLRKLTLILQGDWDSVIKLTFTVSLRCFLCISQWRNIVAQRKQSASSSRLSCGDKVQNQCSWVSLESTWSPTQIPHDKNI